MSQQAVAPRSTRAIVKEVVYDKLGEVTLKILPADVSKEQYQASLVSLLNATPELVGCELPSLAVAIFNAARCGLDFNPALGHAYLTPQKVSHPKLGGDGRPIVDERTGKKIWLSRQLVRLTIGYKGFIFLGRRCGLTQICEPRVVYEGDAFEWDEGVPPRLSHRPTLKTKERGEIIGAYARAELANGRQVFRVIDMDEVHRAMSASPTAFTTAYDPKQRKRVKTEERNPTSPWSTHFPEMVLKTAVRRFYKGFDLGDPQARPMAAVMQADDLYAIGRTPLPTLPTGGPIEAPAQLGVGADWGDADLGPAPQEWVDTEADDPADDGRQIAGVDAFFTQQGEAGEP